MAKNYSQMLKDLQKYFSVRSDQNILAIILVGSISWILTMIKSGRAYDYGLGFWGPNGHDGIWHISLANSLSQGKFSLPIFAGASIKNYHIGFDLTLAILHKLTSISLADLYFRLLPILISLSIGFLLYKLLNLMKWDNSQIFWALFFVYFGGNFGWKGESQFWSQQSISTLINPPFALSLVFILIGLIFLNQKKIILASIFLGLLIQIKAYASVIMLGSLFLVGLYEYFIAKNFNLLKVFLISSLISMAIFLPFNFMSGSLLEFKSFWFLETMMSFPDRVGWAKYGEAMVNYKLAGNLIKGIPAYLIAFLIFWYGNMGTRFIGELYIAKFKFSRNKISNIELIILLSILIGGLLPIFFVQKGTAWNTIQFFYYSLFFSSILAGFIFSEIINSRVNIKYKKIYILGIIILTTHTTFKTLKNNYLPSRPPSKISREELEALEFLEDQPDGIVLIQPFDRKLADLAIANPPRPLYLYESTAYVSAFTGQQVFLEDEVNLDITGFDWQSRRSDVEDYFKNPNKNFLAQNDIKYVYVAGELADESHRLELRKIFENSEVSVYQVD